MFKTFQTLLISSVLMFPTLSLAKKVAPSEQYCTTSQDITVRNGETVTSETKVQCSDDQLAKLIEVRTGHASNCGYSINNIKKGHAYVRQKFFHCRDTDGTIITISETDLR